jgi:hypothetical protein
VRAIAYFQRKSCHILFYSGSHWSLLRLEGEKQHQPANRFLFTLACFGRRCKEALKGGQTKFRTGKLRGIPLDEHDSVGHRDVPV